MADLDSAFRRSISMVVSAILKANGFESADKMALETLVEALIGFISEAGVSAKNLTEVSGRTDVIPKDINLALMDMGFNLTSVIPDAQKQLKQGRIYVPPPRNASQPPIFQSLKVGKTKTHPGYVPEFLPPFPDPHTYETTDVTEDPDMGYRQIREVQAEQQRNVESALVNFMLKINPNHLLFPGDKRLALICPEKESQPYLSALVPEDMPESSNNEAQHILTDNPYLKPPKLPLRRATVLSEFDRS